MKTLELFMKWKGRDIIVEFELGPIGADDREIEVISAREDDSMMADTEIQLPEEELEEIQEDDIFCELAIEREDNSGD